jgi:hypothetical protein
MKRKKALLTATHLSAKKKAAPPELINFPFYAPITYR